MASQLRRFIVLVAVFGIATAVSAANAVHTTKLQHMIAEESNKCDSGDDSMACIKVRAMRFLDTAISKDHFKISDLEVRANGFQPTAESKARSNSGDFFTTLENYIQGHDVTMEVPLADAKVTVSSRNLNNDELNLKIKFADDNAVVEGKGKKGNIFKKGKKHRLRKMAMPIMVLILLKAMTLIPMAIGILKIKAFNALALGFFSFIVSVGLAIFQLCKKIAAEHHPAHITAHGPWDGRSVSSNIEQYQQIESAQGMAYKGYV